METEILTGNICEEKKDKTYKIKNHNDTTKKLSIDKIRLKRLAYGISQNKLATRIGITRQYLSELEKGKKKADFKLLLKLDTALECFNPDNELTMLFDYVRIRFPTTDIDYVIKNILRIKKEYMLCLDYAFYSYSYQYVFGDITVMYSPDILKGCLLELKGKGCRQYESFLLAQHRSWFDFFNDILSQNGVIKRLDLAINDKAGLLDIEYLADKCKKEECISVFRSFKNYKSGELVQRDEETGMGNTLYIGSLKSEVYFCIYEKDYEQYVKTGIKREESEVKNRFEIRLKNERAYLALLDLMENEDIGSTIFSIINRYIRFVDRQDDKNRNEWKTSKQWEEFLGANKRSLRLTVNPEPYSFDKTLNWLSRQVAPTLKLARMLDRLKGTCILNTMINKAKLSKKHYTLLRQQAFSIEEITE